MVTKPEPLFWRCRGYWYFNTVPQCPAGWAAPRLHADAVGTGSTALHHGLLATTSHPWHRQPSCPSCWAQDRDQPRPLPALTKSRAVCEESSFCEKVLALPTHKPGVPHGTAVPSGNIQQEARRGVSPSRCTALLRA